MTKKDGKAKRPRCGLPRISDGKPCAAFAVSCRWHAGDVARVLGPTERRQIFADGLAQGKRPVQAALDAGYSESTANTHAYTWRNDPDVKRRIEDRLEESGVDTREAIGTLVSHMRADIAEILPDNPIVKAAKARGISHWIREIKVTERFISNGAGKEPDREVKTEVKLYDAQAAAVRLLSNDMLERLLALKARAAKDFEEAVDRYVERAKAAGLTVTREEAAAALKPLFQKVIDATDTLN